MDGDTPCEMAADVHQLVAGPTSTGLAVGAGVRIDVRVMGQAVVIGQDLVDRTAAGGVWIEDLVQKGEEGKFGGINTLAAVVLGFIGLEQSGVNPVGADGFQVVQGTTAEEGFGRGQEWGVKLAEQGRGRIHLSAYIPIVLLTS